MAIKRMFDRAIIDTDRFMDLSMSAKALYFLLGMEADDEGFVSYKKIMRIHGGNEDDIKILVAKKFLIIFDSGVVVITDWNKNNWLDTRRIRPTEYQKEKALIILTKDRKYLLSDGLASIEQNSIEQSSKESARTPKKDYFLNDFEDVWSIYPRKVGKGGARKAWEKIPMTSELVAIIKKSVEDHKKTDQWRESPKYIPHFATFLNQERWTDEIEVGSSQKEAIVI